jgi:hypothetical protein
VGCDGLEAFLVCEAVDFLLRGRHGDQRVVAGMDLFGRVTCWTVYISL